MPSIIDQQNFTQHLGNGVTTAFAYQFGLLQSSDFKAYINDVVVPSSNYTLDGVGNQFGGTCTFLTAPASGDKVLLVRELELARTAEYQEQGDLLSGTVNLDFNRIWQALQQQRSSIGGAIRAPFPEQFPALPGPTQRANKQLLFDSLGGLYLAPPPTGSVADILLQLINRSDPAKGAALVGNNPLLAYPLRTVGDYLRNFVRPQDLGATPGGTVDATSFIQQALNSGQPVLIDELFLTSGNEVPTGTHLVFRGRGKLKLANGSNRPVLQNTRYSRTVWGGATYGLDRDIYIDGLNIDGNDDNQAHDLASGPYAKEFVSGVRFGGVTNLTIKNATISRARTFGIWCYAIYNGTFHNIRFDQKMTGTPDNQDGLHINGPGFNLDIRNIYGSTNDDMVALNADDGDLGANFTLGPIVNATIEGVYPNGSLNGIRLLSSTSLMDRITVRTVKGTTRDVVVNQSPFGLGGPGNVGSLTIEDIDVRCSNPYQPITSNYYACIGLDGIINTVALRNIQWVKPADNRPILFVNDTANIGVLTIDGVSATEVAGSTITGIKPFKLLGRFNTVILTNVGYFRDQTLTPTGNLIAIEAPGRGITNLFVNNCVTQGFVTPIYLQDGSLENLIIDGMLDRNGLAGYPVVGLTAATGPNAPTNFINKNLVTDAGRQIVTISGFSTFGTKTMTDACGVSGALATLTANQAIGTGSYVLLALANLVYDRVGGEFAVASRSFTVKQALGSYLVSVTLDVSVTGTSGITVALYKNGTLHRVFPGSGTYSAAAVIGGTINVQAALNDVFDIRINTTAAITVNNSASTQVVFERFK